LVANNGAKIPGSGASYKIPDPLLTLIFTRQSCVLLLGKVTTRIVGPLVALFPDPEKKDVTLLVIPATAESPAPVNLVNTEFPLPDSGDLFDCAPVLGVNVPYGFELMALNFSCSTNGIKILLLFYYLFVKLTAYLKGKNETQLPE
jgi:hypothetical protein